MSALQSRWPVAVVLAGVIGCLPFTVSGLPEFCAIVAVPFVLGFLINRWWRDTFTRLALSVALPLFGAAIRLASSSLHDSSNWFGRLFRAVSAVGIGDPYIRQLLLTLLFPVSVTIMATVIFMTFQRRAYSKVA